MIKERKFLLTLLLLWCLQMTFAQNAFLPNNQDLSVPYEEDLVKVLFNWSFTHTDPVSTIFWKTVSDGNLMFLSGGSTDPTVIDSNFNGRVNISSDHDFANAGMYLSKLKPSDRTLSFKVEVTLDTSVILRGTASFISLTTQLSDDVPLVTVNGDLVSNNSRIQPPSNDIYDVKVELQGLFGGNIDVNYTTGGNEQTKKTCPGSFSCEAQIDPAGLTEITADVDYGAGVKKQIVIFIKAATTTTTTTTTTKPPTTLRDPCVDHEPCLNGGNCHPTDPYNAVCNCTDNYSGVQCQISGCDTKICNNGGTCYNTASTAFCTCLSCWTGDDCSIYSGTNNPCVPSPCIHGSCSVDCTFLYQCKCSVNYQGRNCSQKFDKINEQGYRYAPLLGSNLTLSLTTNETTELWWSRTENGSPLTVRKTGKSFPLVFSPVYFANGTRLYRCTQITPYVQCKVVNIYPTYDWGKTNICVR